jgi:hypothetical protein
MVRDTKTASEEVGQQTDRQSNSKTTYRTRAKKVEERRRDDRRDVGIDDRDQWPY